MINIINNAINKLKKTKEIVFFGFQLEFSIRSGLIGSENICKELLVDEGDEEFLVCRDWSYYKEVLKNDFAVTTKISLVNQAIICCKESYASLFLRDKKSNEDPLIKWAKKNENFELYSAQMIIKLIRNALGHMYADRNSLDATAVWIFEDNRDRDIFEIKSMNIRLDTTQLEGKVFYWRHIGGIKNFLKVLDFLIKDLELRLAKLKYSA